MSDPMNPTAPAARARPSSVTISSYLLFLVAALLVIGAIASFTTLGAVTETYEELYAGTDAEGSEGLVVAFTVGAGVLNLLIAGGLALLALFNNRGKNASRITTWVVGGIGLCCTGGGLASNALSSSFNVESGANMPDPDEVQRRMNDALGWVGPFSMVTSVLILIALLVALILLALPPSNEFFRKPQATWEPPVPGYPQQPGGGYPGYPQQPGTPPAPGQQPPYPGGPQNPPGGPQNPSS